METEDFWQLIQAARSRTTAEGSFDRTLVETLTARSKREILKYQERFDALHGALYRWDVWAAAYLIGGGCSDDSFTDFRAGVIAEGQAWYERVAANPDSLAEHPLIAAAAEAGKDHVLFDEEVNYAAADAFGRLTGDRHDFYEAWDQYRKARPYEQAEQDMGEDFDFDDEQMHRRLPRLAALYLPGTSV
ncbi:DUF4240 domain-containing protein [Actinacidiphila yeochonensis]|uniref:DUF4240 domain-containing protein n=1 Tax=Actinacidiphila yeochonensis TaxID=89050 RepID=UPI00056C1099|nr:DUF4240 domain-containing protein [Actinacidiphila yeochonensis]